MGISGHEIGRVLYDGSVAGAYKVADPGTAGTIDMKNASFGVCELTLAAAGETRTLPTATLMGTGVHLIIVVASTGAGYYTSISSATTLSVAGDIAHYVTYFNGTTTAWTNITSGQSSTAVTPVVALTGSTTIVPSFHAYKTLSMTGTGAAYTQTMPVATGSGRRYLFVVGAVNTSNHIISVATASATLKGTILTKTASESNDVAQAWLSTAGTAITLNGTTTGGAAVGDYVELIDLATDVYMVRGVTNGSGSEATSFS